MAVTVPVQEITAPSPNVAATRGAFRILLANRKFVAGASVFGVLLVVCIVGGVLAGPIPLRSGSFAPKLNVGGAGFAILGTTSLGQSVLAQLFQAIPNSMLVGLVAAAIGT